LDVLKRLFNSAHFFKEFQEFQQAYVDACNTLLELSKDTQLTMLERRKLSTIAEEYLMTYSIDLINFGLNYKPPHEYRYRPLLLQMQLLNGQLTREVIPVGLLINLSPPDDGTGPTPLIIKP
jgi:hypothetical protein